MISKIFKLFQKKRVWYSGKKAIPSIYIGSHVLIRRVGSHKSVRFYVESTWKVTTIYKGIKVQGAELLDEIEWSLLDDK
jgi:hypothetical protein